MTKKEIKQLILSVLFIGVTISLIKSTWDMLKSNKRLEELENEVNTLNMEKNQVEESIKYKETDEFVEEFARNELNLIKPGEDVYVVINSDNIDNPNNNAIPQEIVENKKVYKQWIELFF